MDQTTLARELYESLPRYEPTRVLPDMKLTISLTKRYLVPFVQNLLSLYGRRTIVQQVGTCFYVSIKYRFFRWAQFTPNE